MIPAATQIADYSKTVFTAETREGHCLSHDVYHRGSGAPVVLIQELPGIGHETLALADRLVGAGFEVIMPHLFGPIGRISIGGNLLRVLCLSFTVLGLVPSVLQVASFFCGAHFFLRWRLVIDERFGSCCGKHAEFDKHAALRTGALISRHKSNLDQSAAVSTERCGEH